MYTQIKNDFNDFDNIIDDDNHVVRRYYRAYVDGDYAAAFTASDFDGTKAVRGWKCSGGDSAGNTAISSDYLPANCR